MFEWIFENLPHEIYIFHPESLKFVAVNRAARRNLDYTADELNAMSLSVISPEFDQEMRRHLLRPLLNGKQDKIMVSTSLHRKNGSVYPAEIVLQLFHCDGTAFCMATIADTAEQDILQEKVETFNTIMNAARDAIVVLDNHGGISFWNIAAQQLFGYSREEVLGKGLHRLLVSEESLYETSRRAFKDFQSAGTGYAIGKTTELKAKHKDGHELDLELSLSALRIGNTWHAVGIVRDIGERKKVQEELERRQQRYLELAENAPVGILSCDNNGNITYVNQRVLEMLGSADIEETRKINLLTFPLLVNHGFSKKLEECILRKESAMFEMNYESKWEKKVWLKIHIKPQIRKNTVTGAQVILDDIAEKKRLEGELLILSVTDSLTNVYNRRYFIQKLEEEIGRAERTGNGFSIIMMDIDYFKRINDCFGHNTGDLVLKKIVSEIIENIRKIDTLARWGGEEFMLLLPETALHEAVILAERLRQCIISMEIPDMGNVTVSFGVADYFPGDTVDKIVHKADIMMYEAKSAGRNCVRYIKESQ